MRGAGVVAIRVDEAAQARVGDAVAETRGLLERVRLLFSRRPAAVERRRDGRARLGDKGRVWRVAEVAVPLDLGPS